MNRRAVLTRLRRSVGDILSRLSADTTQVSDLISQNVNIFLRNAIKGAGDFIVMCGMSWRLSLVTIMGFPFIALVSKLYGDYYKVEQLLRVCAGHLICREN